jgi:TRAP-type C4-dicarboxylate transport system permease small subunit
VRRFLDGLYDGAAWLAALFMVGLLFMVLLGIVSRLAHFHVPGTDAYAGYFMAHTLKRGEHIRVTLLLSALRGGSKRGIELWALAAAVFLAGLSAFYSCKLAWQSHAFNDISTSNDATPLWIPQLAMAAGNLILLVAFIDELVLEWRGQRPSHPEGEAEALHNE